MTRQETNRELAAIAKGMKQLLYSAGLSGIASLPRGSLGENRRGQIGKSEQLEPIRQEALRCQACRLSKTRRSVVFGEGSLEAHIVFVGEGPGQEEDSQGRPFVGAAGKLLDKMIQAMGLRREQVYIANVVKCRPPQNRVPLPDEIASCLGYLERQLEILRPRVICTLGRTATNSLLKSEAPMSELRGKVHDRQGIPLVATFHPAYLLRNPSAKSLAWADLQLVLQTLNSR